MTKILNLILASRSPRRREILKATGIPFASASPSGVDETAHTGENPEKLVARLARAKAEKVASLYPDSWILGCDTVVVLGKRVLGKPRDPKEARSVLSRLSGRTHRVLTGLAWIGPRGRFLENACIETKVEFRKIPERELAAYLNSLEPYDKAGAYGIQGSAGRWVRRLEGDYTNVVGLPINRVLQDLWRFGQLNDIKKRY